MLPLQSTTGQAIFEQVRSAARFYCILFISVSIYLYSIREQKNNLQMESSMYIYIK